MSKSEENYLPAHRIARILLSIPATIADNMGVDPQADSILIVDDSPSDRAIVEALLDAAGSYAVQSVRNGVEALEVLCCWPATACLVDFDMPGMDGLELIRRITQGFPNVVCILITGTPLEDIIQEARAAGAKASLSKADLTPTLLDDTIGSVLTERTRHAS